MTCYGQNRLPAAHFNNTVIVGAQRDSCYLPLLKGKRVAVYSNHTGITLPDSLHIVDRLVAAGIDVKYIFAPEHGFRGDADAGAHIADGRDPRTGIKVLSLYGPGKRKALEALSQVDVVVTDIQDVGLRFYTYYCTQLELMNAAPDGVEFIILDRPNPTAPMGIDGPVLDMQYQSGVGRLPIPVLHGMTLCELMLMARGEGWLEGGRTPVIHPITCLGYTHATRYELPVAPSPNLPNIHAIYLYPSLCFFEGTPVSLGRGTPWPFEVYGHPSIKSTGHPFSFTPRPGHGSSQPPCNGRQCRGRDLRDIPADTLIARGLDLSYVIDAYNSTPRNEQFFKRFFTLLAGTPALQQAIVRGDSAASIKQSWQRELAEFDRRRQPYLLYD